VQVKPTRRGQHSLILSLALSPSGSVPEQELVVSLLLTLFLDPKLRSVPEQELVVSSLLGLFLDLELQRSLASKLSNHMSASVSR
jgi:hypothetical protein